MMRSHFLYLSEKRPPVYGVLLGARQAKRATLALR